MIFHTDLPRSAIAAQVLILVNAAFWLIFTVVAALGILPGALSAGLARWVMAGLALGTALVLSFLCFMLNKQKKWAYYASILVLLIIAVLSITDEAGLFDWLILIISLTAIVLMMVERSWFLTRQGQNNQGEV